jgi:hypothetical protein
MANIAARSKFTHFFSIDQGQGAYSLLLLNFYILSELKE